MLHTWRSRNAISLAIALLCIAALLPLPAAAAPTPRAPSAPPGQEGEESEWLIMLFQNADDEVLEGDIFTDLNEAELVGSTDDVIIVSQFDRYDGAFDGDGDWTRTVRFLVSQDDDITTTNSEVLEDMGEIDNGDPQTLSDFIIWAVTNFPAKKHALILSDHGAGWQGGWTDNSPNEGSALSVDEIDGALATALAETGLEQLEFIGFDACLMSQVEALTGVAPYARYAVASEETEPAMGWAYAAFLGELAEDPGRDGAELAKSIVDSYINQDIRIQDDEQRAEYLAQVYGVEEEVSAEEVGAAASQDVTLTAVDLQAMPAYMDALNEFAFALTSVDPLAVAQARTYAQSYTSVFGEEAPPSFLDVGHFASLVSELAESKELNTAVKSLQKAAGKLILAEMHGPNKPGSTGLTFFFPAPELLEIVGTDEYDLSYTDYASRFAGASLWDDFLVFHYTNRDIDPDLADLTLLDPETGPEADLDDYSAALLDDPDLTYAPGVEGDLSLAPIEVSSDSISADDTVLLQTSISGENIGYIYIEAARYDEESDSFSIEDRDFVAADKTEAIEGVAYPVWTERDLEDFIFEWSPTFYTLSDGETEAFALFNPEVYGADTGGGEYAVYGVYTFGGSGDQRDAVMLFDGDLKFKSIFGFSGPDGTGAPREITPQAGDQFTLYEEWIETDEDGNEVVNQYEGETLTFGDQPFIVTAYDALAGDYVLGITVTDLFGNEITEYASVNVTEPE